MSNAAQLRAALEARRARNFQGVSHVKPLRLVDKVFGDGRQLIALQPPNTGPNYYVVRIDSSWQLSDQGLDGSLLAEHIGEVIAALEAQFGPSWYVGDPPKRGDDGRPFRPTKDDSGCCWFALNWPPGHEPPSIETRPDDRIEGPAP